jgi:hypothetical protein
MTATEIKPGRTFRDHRQKVTISLPSLDFCNLQAAMEEDREGKPAGKQCRIEKFDDFDHLKRIEMIDSHNHPFRFYYVPATKDGKELYFRVPIVGGQNVNSALLAQRISRDFYDRNALLVDNVARVDRILRAIPFRQITVNLRRFLIAAFIAEEEAKLGKLKTKERNEALANAPRVPFYEKTAIIGLDRGNRLPTIILNHLLNPSTKPLFVSANGRVDEQALETLAKKGAFTGKHILLSDSETVDPAKMEVFRCIFGPNGDPNWLRTLGHTGWSIAGPSENSHKVAGNHLQIDWGIDPRVAFGTPLPEVEKLDSRHKVAATLKRVLTGYVYPVPTE